MFSNRLNLTDRISIEYGLCAGKSFTEIANSIGKSVSTISREIKSNREFIHGTFFLGNDCRFSRTCNKMHVCGNKYCNAKCVRCRNGDCRDKCIHYRPYICTKIDYPPFVCNHCASRRDCFKNRYLYSAKFAQKNSNERLSSTRKGIRISDKEMVDLDLLLKKGIKKGQPIAHIYEQHKCEIPVSLRTIYNYIEEDVLSIKSIDLRRKVKYKKRKKKNTVTKQQHHRLGRSYKDFQDFVLNNPNVPIVQLDTVKGQRKKAKLFFQC